MLILAILTKFEIIRILKDLAVFGGLRRSIGGLSIFHFLKVNDDFGGLGGLFEQFQISEKWKSETKGGTLLFLFKYSKSEIIRILRDLAVYGGLLAV